MPSRIVIVGLGPGGPGLVTAATLGAIDAVPTRFLRTTRHPSAPLVGGATSFDHHYDEADTFDEVYRRIVDDLIAAAREHGEVLYAVPGSPRVLERSVEQLVAAADDPGLGIDVDVRAAMSFLDLTWVRLGIDPMEDGVRLVDAHRFGSRAAGERGPMLVAHCHNRRVLSDIKLSVPDLPGLPVTVLQRLGTENEAIFSVAWEELDRSFEPDHLTSLWVPELGAPVAGEVQAFVELVATLRDRCPWDRAQTHHTLRRHLLEETYEVLEAIDALPVGAEGGDGSYDHLEEELGDLLFQVVFHAGLAAEAGAFTLADVARGIHDKLVGRHPHVFADASSNLADITRTWEEIKREEKGRASLMDGIGEGLPSLLYAHKVQRKAASVGLDPVADDVGGLGGELFALVDRCRRAHVDPEAALRATAGRFRNRFQAAETLAAERGIGIPEVWNI